MQTRPQNENEGIERIPQIIYTLPIQPSYHLYLNILTQAPTVALLPPMTQESSSFNPNDYADDIQQPINQDNQRTDQEFYRFIMESQASTIHDPTTDIQQLSHTTQQPPINFAQHFANNTNTFYMDPNGTAHHHPRNEEPDPDMSLDSAPTP